MTERKLPSFAVVLVERGQGWLETAASGRLSLTGPALFWLFPNRVHSYGPDEGGWDERWALFEGSFTRDFVRLRIISERHPVVALHHLDEMVRLFGKLHADLLDDTNLGQASAALMLHRIVISVARQASGAADRRQERPPDTAKIVETLRRRAMQPLDLATFAAEHGMSLKPRCAGGSRSKPDCLPRHFSFGRAWIMPNSYWQPPTKRSKRWPP